VAVRMAVALSDPRPDTESGGHAAFDPRAPGACSGPVSDRREQVRRRRDGPVDDVPVCGGGGGDVRVAFALAARHRAAADSRYGRVRAGRLRAPAARVRPAPGLWVPAA